MDKKAYLTANPLERLYYISNIPTKYWTVDNRKLQPTQIEIPINNKVKYISSQLQNDWIQKLLKNFSELKTNYLFSIGSSPTDVAAMRLACAFAKRALIIPYEEFSRYTVQVVNSAELWKLKYHKSLDMLIIYNIIDCISRERIQEIRDILLRYENAFRVVVSANMNPYMFCLDTLKLEPHGAFYFHNVMSV